MSNSITYHSVKMFQYVSLSLLSSISILNIYLFLCMFTPSLSVVRVCV